MEKEEITYDKIREAIEKMKELRFRSGTIPKMPFIIIRKSFFIKEAKLVNPLDLDLDNKVYRFLGAPTLSLEDQDFDKIIDPEMNFFTTYDLDTFERVKLLARYYELERAGKYENT